VCAGGGFERPTCSRPCTENGDCAVGTRCTNDGGVAACRVE
jgi:hypothetical protein